MDVTRTPILYMIKDCNNFFDYLTVSMQKKTTCSCLTAFDLTSSFFLSNS